MARAASASSGPQMRTAVWADVSWPPGSPTFCSLPATPLSNPAAADGLWWLGEGRAVAALRRLLLLVSLALFLAALEERVVFHSFNQYIRLTAPWNYLAVTGEGERGAHWTGQGRAG